MRQRQLRAILLVFIMAVLGDLPSAQGQSQSCGLKPLPELGCRIGRCGSKSVTLIRRYLAASSRYPNSAAELVGVWMGHGSRYVIATHPYHAD